MALRSLTLLCLAGAALGQDRYWGSYTASYPAGGGGTSGALARTLATLQEAPRAQAPRAQAPRALAPRAGAQAPRARAQAPRAQLTRAQDTSSYSAALAEAEPGQYVHNPDWDLTPFQLWKRRQAAKTGAVQPVANTVAGPARQVVTVRKQAPLQQQARPAPRQEQARPAPRQARPETRQDRPETRQRFQNFRPVENRRPAPAQPTRQDAQPTRQAALPTRQAAQPTRQAARQQAYYQPAPQGAVQPAYAQPAQPAYIQPAQPAYVQPAQPAYAQPSQPAYAQPSQPAYAQPAQPAAYPRAQHQTYTPEYIFEANNNAQRIYSYQAVSNTGLEYGAQAKGDTSSYWANY